MTTAAVLTFAAGMAVGLVAGVLVMAAATRAQRARWRRDRLSLRCLVAQARERASVAWAHAGRTAAEVVRLRARLDQVTADRDHCRGAA